MLPNNCGCFHTVYHTKEGLSLVIQYVDQDQMSLVITVEWIQFQSHWLLYKEIEISKYEEKSGLQSIYLLY